MVLYQCKETYTITVKNAAGNFYWDFNKFPCEFDGDRAGECYIGTVPFSFRPDNIPLVVSKARLFFVRGFLKQPWAETTIDIALCFAADHEMQSVTIVPIKSPDFQVIEDSDNCNILRYFYDDSSYFEILLSSTKEERSTDTIWLHIMNVYQE